jgi:hypothetical protein
MPRSGPIVVADSRRQVNCDTRGDHHQRDIDAAPPSAAAMGVSIWANALKPK